MRIITIILIATVIVASASAQTRDGRTQRQADKHANYFVSVGAGVQSYLGEGDSGGSFGKRITPAVEVAVGKWFTPVWGARVGYSGCSYNGFTANKNNPYAEPEAISDGLYQQKFNSMNFHVDILFNLSSAICPNPRRFYEIIPYGGIGYATSFKSDKPSANSISINAGLINRFRLSRKLDANLTFAGMVVRQRYDHEFGGIRIEGAGAITAGLTYKF